MTGYFRYYLNGYGDPHTFMQICRLAAPRLSYKPQSVSVSASDFTPSYPFVSGSIRHHSNAECIIGARERVGFDSRKVACLFCKGVEIDGYHSAVSAANATNQTIWKFCCVIVGKSSIYEGVTQTFITLPAGRCSELTLILCDEAGNGPSVRIADTNLSVVNIHS